MNKKKIFFWADASQTIGYGHFIRTLALADMMKDDFECVFFTQTPNDYQRNEVEKVCSLVELPDNDSKFRLFLDYLSGDEIIFLDNYFNTFDYQKQIKEKGCKLVCMGDRVNCFCSDVVIGYIDDPTIINAVPETKKLMGIEWVILRKPFIMIKNHRDLLLPPSVVSVCIGGTDQFCITEKVVDTIIESHKFFPKNIHAIGSFSDDRCEQFLSKGISIHKNLDGEKMANLFASVDITICSASTVAQESLAVGTPVIAGYYVDNQKLFYQYLLDNSYINGIGNLLDNNMSSSLLSRLDHYDVNSTKVFDVDSAKHNYLKLFSDGI